MAEPAYRKTLLEAHSGLGVTCVFPFALRFVKPQR